MVSAGARGPVHVVWSEFLGQGSEQGFAFVFHSDRLTGAAKPTKGTSVFLSDVVTILRDLGATKVFDVAAEDVSRVEILGPTAESLGRIVVRTAREIHVVNVSRAPIAAEDPIPVLIPRFEEFAPARVVRPR